MSLLPVPKEGDAFFVTPYYLSLLNIEHEGYDDATVRSYIMYSNELVDTYGSIKAWEKEDMVVADEPNAAAGYCRRDIIYTGGIRRWRS